MIDQQQVDDTIESQLDQQLDELSTLCAQPSIAAQSLGMDECARLVAKMLERRQFSVQVIPTKGFPVVLAERSGQSDRTLMFYNHYDVQPPEPLDLWDSPPFQPTLRDGKLYARGVSDDKGHIQCRLSAIDAILAHNDELPCNVKFVIEGEEEIGSLSLPAFVRGHQAELEADGCIWEFGGVNHEGRPVQVAGLRGICYVELSVTTASQDAHSGLGGSIFPNAAWRLVWALRSLKGTDERIRLPGFYDRVIPPTEKDLALLAALPDPSQEYLSRYQLDGFIKGIDGGLDLKREAIFSPTCTICGLTSGYQGEGTKTVLPAKARAKVDFRLVPDQDPEEVVLLLRNHLDEQGFEDIDITYLGGGPAARTDPDDPFLKMVVKTAEEVYGQSQLIDPMSGGSGPNALFVKDLRMPVATAGIGYPGSQAHAPNENIVLEHFVKGAKHTARIIGAFAELQ
jgi:acetylornithine deacetylase/succinyl-diaminopimelate desuccinylase-like protein